VIRYAYNQASVAGKPYRLVFDLTEQAYWLEVGPDIVVVQNEDEADKKDVSDKKKSKDGKVTEKKSDEVDETTDDETADEEAKEVPPPTAFGPVDEDIVKKTKLGDEVFIRDVYVIHQKDIVVDDLAYLYFFPSGMTEMAVIHFSNEDHDKNYTLSVNPVTGGVKVDPDYIEYETILGK
ncbi:MAG: hypothetical protein ACD_73C00433G0001, partial [uncultured bacterium]